VARDTLIAALDVGWADPRRLYREGRRAAMLLNQAREVLAGGLGMRPDEVSLHPTGTHALLAGLAGLRRARHRVGEQIHTSAVDQAAVLRRLPAAARVPVDSLGCLDTERWARAVNAPGVALGVLAAANHEVGTCQPLREAADACAAARVPLLVDLAASWGRAGAVPSQGQAYAADAASFAGPPLGVLGVRTGTRFDPAYPRSAPEHGLSLAQPVVPFALAAAEAWQQSAAERAREELSATALVERIREAASGIPDVQVVGDPVHRLPHIVTFSVLYVDGEALVHELDRRGFAVASGSACTSDTLEPSHVLAAMGVVTHGNVRITLPLEAVAPERDRDVARFCQELPDAVAAVRAQLGTDRL